MKTPFLTLLFTAFFITITAQETPQVGDQLMVNGPSNQFYNHVDFPQLNFLVKRGKIANYKSVKGNHVEISHVETDKNGTQYVTLKKKDGGKFFGYLNSVKANYNKSINSGELSVIQ
ncbi:hypothetical protein ACFFU1_08555 [Algibacter miyuki]|uniref:Uncharacterized protein n=1 Tax=Algibacter miyuki TaxID=1306933 RepID=A0ABV5GZB0_9FLAO|nr:hypothetical protein [Algibacter miyuki]MDN3664185.1 hypothetical protein [Algibacter miyuki]MDN3666855.1 hypothetical protein [Algibacter miyuki]